MGNPLTNSLGIRCCVTLAREEFGYILERQGHNTKSPNSKIELNCTEKNTFLCADYVYWLTMLQNIG